MSSHLRYDEIGPGNAINEMEFQSEEKRPVRTHSPVFNVLLIALQNRLQPLALVRRRLSDYSLGSRRKVTSQVMPCSEEKDTLENGDEMAVVKPCSPDSAEVPGICWKFAHHGQILHTESLHFKFN